MKKQSPARGVSTTQQPWLAEGTRRRLEGEVGIPQVGSCRRALAWSQDISHQVGRAVVHEGTGHRVTARTWNLH